jgi:hypothetical protein
VRRPLEVQLEAELASPAILVAPESVTPQVASTLRIVLALSTIYIIWGSAFLGIRIAIQDFPPFLMSGLRYVLAGGVLYIFVWLRGEQSPRLRECWRRPG